MKHYYPPKQENLPGTGIDGEFGDAEFAAIEEAREDSLELIDLSEYPQTSTLIKDHVIDYIESMMCGEIVSGITCDIAERKLHADYPDMEHLVEDEAGCTRYADESQVLFDEIYDDLFGQVEKLIQKYVEIARSMQ